LAGGGWARVETFPEVEPNPSWKTVLRGVARANEAGARAVLAVGGGSTLDAGKVIAEQCGAVSLCTVPTTAGTGGEISPWAVISNVETREKESVVAKWPDLALLDAELTVSLPPRTTLFTGMDAFLHGLEAYLSGAATPITDALALGGMELTAGHLREAVERGNDLRVREAMLQGSLLTGAAMLHAGLGLMHAIGNVTGGLCDDMPHGMILIRCMDPVLEFNRPVVGPELSRVEPLVERVRKDSSVLLDRLDVAPIRIAAADLPLLAKRALANINAKTNPRPATLGDVEALARKAFRID
jgi:alcohol dehydrogenase class IV